KAWVTEGIRPGVVACSHHMGRWRPATEQGQRQSMAVVDLDHDGSQWGLTRRRGVEPYQSTDPDTARIWWTDVGVHQNLTFGVHPDPISGAHCWHQAVTVRKAEPGDSYADVVVDTDRSRRVYQEWLQLARDARRISPDRTRRPKWIMRPLKPEPQAWELAPTESPSPPPPPPAGPRRSGHWPRWWTHPPPPSARPSTWIRSTRPI